MPSERKLMDAKQRMLQWWEMAWLDNSDIESSAAHKQRFFAEANIALPGLGANNVSIDDLFEALFVAARAVEGDAAVE